MTECLQYSLNTCMTWLATQMGSDTFYSYLKAFGLDRKTGIDLGGENTWPLKIPGDNQWYEVDLATNSFGQGISLTPIQMAMSIGSLANDGRMMTPRVVKAMIINGQQYEIDPVVVGTPIKAETAVTITEMLHTSLEDEASIALVEGYSIAGRPEPVRSPLNLATLLPAQTLHSSDGDQSKTPNSWSMSGLKNPPFRNGVLKQPLPPSQSWSASWLF